jgi:hypothetical protein
MKMVTSTKILLFWRKPSLYHMYETVFHDKKPTEMESLLFCGKLAPTTGAAEPTTLLISHM